MNVEGLSRLAKEIQDANPNFIILTGSLALTLQGYKTRREPHDIDFLYWMPIDAIALVPGMKIISKDGKEQKYPDFVACEIERNGETIKVDFLYSDESYESINCIHVASPEFIIEAKRGFANQDNPSAEKHKLDVEYLESQPKPNIQYDRHFDNDISFPLPF